MIRIALVGDINPVDTDPGCVAGGVFELALPSIVKKQMKNSQGEKFTFIVSSINSCVCKLEEIVIVIGFSD